MQCTFGYHPIRRFTSALCRAVSSSRSGARLTRTAGLALLLFAAPAHAAVVAPRVDFASYDASKQVLRLFGSGFASPRVLFKGALVPVQSSDSKNVFAKIPGVLSPGTYHADVLVGTLKAGVDVTILPAAAVQTPVQDRTALQIAMLKFGTLAPKSFTVGSSPFGIAFDGTHLWVANSSSGSLSKVRPGDGAVVATYTVGSGPIGLAFDGANVWVTHSGYLISKVRASDGVLTDHMNTFSGWGIAYDGIDVWFSVPGQNLVVKRDTTGFNYDTFTVGHSPRGIAFDGACVWVANFSDNTVTKLRVSDGHVMGTYATGHGPQMLACDGVNMWVGNSADGTVSKLRVADGVSLGTYRVGSYPMGIAFDGSHIWTANLGDSTVTELRASDGTLLNTFTGVGGAFGIAFDGSSIWTTDSSGDTIRRF